MLSDKDRAFILARCEHLHALGVKGSVRVRFSRNGRLKGVDTVLHEPPPGETLPCPECDRPLDELNRETLRCQPCDTKWPRSTVLAAVRRRAKAAAVTESLTGGH